MTELEGWRRLNAAIDRMLKLESDREAAKKFAVEGLLTDGGHHKQWYLERILEALGYDLIQIQNELQPSYDWEEGIAP